MDFTKLVKECNKNNIFDVEYAEEFRDNDSFALFDGVIDEQKTFTTTFGNVRAKVGEKVVSYYVENMLDDNISHIVSSLKKMAEVIDQNSNAIMHNDTKEVFVFDNEINDFSKYSKADKVNYFINLTKKIKDTSIYCSHVRISYVEACEKKTIKNSNGLNKSHGFNFASLMVQAVVSKDNDSRASYYAIDLKNFKDINVDEIIKETVLEALNQIGAKSIESKNYKVVLKNTCMITLLNAFKNQFSSDAVRKNMSAFDKSEGKQIFGKNVNLIDDPYKDEFNHVPFDDEGVDTFKKYVVKDGVLSTFLYNLDTATEAKRKSTGNGFKSNGIKGNVGVGPSNLYFKEGNKTLEELFSDVENGVYITNFQGAHAGINAASGDFNLQSSGYLIENGKLGRPVTLIITSGNFFDMMNHVVESANDLKFMFGCGASSTYIEKLNISGK